MLLILQQGFLFFFLQNTFPIKGNCPGPWITSSSILGNLASSILHGVRALLYIQKEIFSSEWHIAVTPLLQGNPALVSDQTLSFTFPVCSIHVPNISLLRFLPGIHTLHLYKHMQSNLFKWIVFEKYIITGGKRGQFDILIMGIIITNVTAMHMCICRDCWQDCLFSLRTQL